MLYHFIKKEFLLITRDIHALLVLFVMPLVFITIMSYALKNNFSGQVDVKYQVGFSLEMKKFKSSFFDGHFEDKNISKKELFYEKGYDFFVDISEDKKDIAIYAKTGISPQYINILQSQIIIALQQEALDKISSKVGLKNEKKPHIKKEFIGKDGKINQINSVDQSVPAWLIFSMFFILIPISNAFINEKNFGTFARIKTMNVSSFVLLFGKFIPYFLVNQIQVLVMILSGVFLMPLIGLESLHVRGDFIFIALVSFGVSCCAISFGLLIANIAKTSEEATTIGGVSNIIFSAIGGIMVPTFVMPKLMQDISAFSPLNWALESFLEVIVKGGGIDEVGLHVAKLCFFAIICFCVSYLLLKRKSELR